MQKSTKVGCETYTNFKVGEEASINALRGHLIHDRCPLGDHLSSIDPMEGVSIKQNAN